MFTIKNTFRNYGDLVVMKQKKKIFSKKMIYILVTLVLVAYSFSFSGDAYAIGKKYSSFSKVKKALLNEFNNGNTGATSCYYDYIKLRTKKGAKKVMSVQKINGAYMTYSEIWIKSGKKVIKKYSFPGHISKVSKNKNYFLTYSYIGSGMGGYRLFKYNKKKKKYTQVCHVNYDTEAYRYPKRETRALKKLEKKGKVKTSKFKKVSLCKHRIYGF